MYCKAVQLLTHWSCYCFLSLRWTVLLWPKRRSGKNMLYTAYVISAWHCFSLASLIFALLWAKQCKWWSILSMRQMTSDHKHMLLLRTEMHLWIITTNVSMGFNPFVKNFPKSLAPKDEAQSFVEHLQRTRVTKLEMMTYLKFCSVQRWVSLLARA